ncbi:MAG TPA: TfoX/Sxy family protein [Candidatus Methanofastidiosa archaeon]|nr:TfoX/Sxy family protein [Candidatus Methanofastidiosa archaeon]HPR41787.1 TfoX/Sxy family protein [Candidatus Methanofastidiosa archaeon]
MAKWTTPSHELEVLLEEMVLGYPCDMRRMFGSKVFFVNGNMFAGVHQDNIFIRVPPEKKDSIIAGNPGVMPFEPMEGNAMREYITIPREMVSDRGLVERLLDMSFHYVFALPTRR